MKVKKDDKWTTTDIKNAITAAFKDAKKISMWSETYPDIFADKWILENTESNELRTMLDTLNLLTIKSNNGYSESIVIPNDDEETVKSAINKIHTENYVNLNCLDWRYKDGYGSYFDRVIWADITIIVSELRVL